MNLYKKPTKNRARPPPRHFAASQIPDPSVKFVG
jgi:hypothetical protein